MFPFRSPYPPPTKLSITCSKQFGCTWFSYFAVVTNIISPTYHPPIHPSQGRLPGWEYVRTYAEEAQKCKNNPFEWDEWRRGAVLMQWVDEWRLTASVRILVACHCLIECKTVLMIRIPIFAHQRNTPVTKRTGSGAALKLRPLPLQGVVWGWVAW